MIASGTADQMPMTLCQLKSRALLRSPFLNSATARTPRQPVRGIQRYMPDSTMNRKIRFDQPLIALPIARPSPSSDNHRCQARASLMKRRTPAVGSPTSWPVYTS